MANTKWLSSCVALGCSGHVSKWPVSSRLCVAARSDIFVGSSSSWMLGVDIDVMTSSPSILPTARLPAALIFIVVVVVDAIRVSSSPFSSSTILSQTSQNAWKSADRRVRCHRAANTSEIYMSIQSSAVDTNAPFALPYIHNLCFCCYLLFKRSDWKKLMISFTNDIRRQRAHVFFLRARPQLSVFIRELTSITQLNIFKEVWK